MAITLRYNPAYNLSMGTAQQTGEGDLLRQLNEIARRESMEQQRLDEGARQFDMGLAAQQYDQQADRGYRWAALGAEVGQDNARLQQQAYSQQANIDARLAEQQMQGDSMLAGQMAQTERSFIGEQSQMAREAANRRFQKSMKDREVLLDMFQRGLLTPQQEQQAKQNWSQQSGMEFGVPDEMANQDASAAEEARVNDIATSFFVNPITGEPLATPQQVRSMLEMGIEPDKIADLGLKRQSEARQLAALEQKEGEADRKLEEEDAKAQQKEEIESNKERVKTMRDSIVGEREYRQSQEEYARDLEQYEEDLKQYELEKSSHSRNTTSARGSAGNAPKPFTKTPPMKPVAPTPGLFADKIPTPRSPEEVQALEPGTRFIAPDGTIRVR